MLASRRGHQVSVESMLLSGVLGEFHEVDGWATIGSIFLHLIRRREPAEKAIAEEEYWLQVFLGATALLANTHYQRACARAR